MTSSTHQNGSDGKIGVLITNLGTPDAPDKKAVRRYLKEFLWDPRVVEAPRPVWWFVLNGIILNTRPAKSAEAYSEVWTEDGSPLLVISERQVSEIRNHLQHAAPGIEVELAMRYGNPSIPSGLKKLQAKGVSKILILPLYPQYSATTTGSTFDAVTREMSSWRWLPEIETIHPYFDNPDYVTALGNSIREHWEEHGQAEKLLMSFHGIPANYSAKGDPYHDQCLRTAQLLAEELQLRDDRFLVTFQSRLGPQKWLQPYTDKTLKKLGRSGCESVQVVCPGFSADCLETLEEIAGENRDYFLGAGGKRYEYIECLNDRQDHITMLCKIIEQRLPLERSARHDNLTNLEEVQPALHNESAA
ncbi:MAG: ferrochelatase [Pseudomonadota bacterium]